MNAAGHADCTITQLMKVRDVMTPKPSCCLPETTLTAVADLMSKCDCGAIPVVGDADGQFPIGMITDRDIVTRGLAGGSNPLKLVARDCMTTPAVTITEDSDLDECLDLLEERQLRRVIVVDKKGRCSGIVAQADVAAHATKRESGKLLRKVSKQNPELRAGNGVM
jgi:CBS domain-containing protein